MVVFVPVVLLRMTELMTGAELGPSVAAKEVKWLTLKMNSLFPLALLLMMEHSGEVQLT